MADREDKNPLNVTGKFYNDLSCIDCDFCREIAPNVFKRDDEEGESYVYRQPVTQEDLELAVEAMESCPTETIGNDG
ncbi:MAG: ferredoxin [Cryomorphaceae bacterium]|jgi:ferredoxin